MIDFSRNVYCILGLPFDGVDMAGAVHRIRRAARERRPCFLSTPNLNFLVGCLTDSRFRESVVHSDLSIADGMPLIWAARLLGIPIRSRVAGSTLFEELRRGDGEQMSVFFFGGPAGAAETACRQLEFEGRGLKCVGYESPGFGSIEEMSADATISKINASGADFLVVALGAKKGQAWIEHNRSRIMVPVISHLGAVLNFTAGLVRRAPKPVQTLGLEWLWRIKEEPTLWRRYLQDGLALIVLLLTRLLPHAYHQWLNKPDAAQLALSRMETTEEIQDHVVQLHGAWDARNIDALRTAFLRAALSEKDVRLELGTVTYVDSAFVAQVMLLHGHLIQHGRKFMMGSCAYSARRVFRFCCAEYLHSNGV